MKRYQSALIVLGLLASLLLALLLAGCGPKPVVKINGAPVTQEDFLAALEKGVGLTEGPATGRRVLDTMITMRLVEKEAQEKGVTISDEEIEKAFQLAKEGIESSGRGSFEEFLKSIGATEAYMKEQVKFNLLLQKLTVTDAEAEQFFSERPGDFDTKSQTTFYQMFLTSQAAAEAARRDVMEGKQDFVTVAKERSMKGSSALPVPPGGIPVAVSTEALGDQDKNLISALKSLQPGQVSQPILETVKIPGPTRKSPFREQPAWRLIYVGSFKPAVKATFANSKEEARRRVFFQKRATGELTQYLNSLKAKARIEIIDPDYQALAAEYQQLARQMPEFKPPAPGAPQMTPEGPSAPAPAGPQPPAPGGAAAPH